MSIPLTSTFRFEEILRKTLYSAHNRVGWILRKLGSKLCEAKKINEPISACVFIIHPNAIDSDQLSAQPTLTFSEIEFRQNVLSDF